MVYSGRRTRAGTVTWRSKKNRRRAVAPAVKRYVKSTITRNIETKKRGTQWDEYTLLSATDRIKYIDGFQQLLQGTNYATLSGHWVKGIGVSLKCLFHNNAAEPQAVRLIMLESKQGILNLDYRTGVSLFENDAGDVNLSSLTGNQYLYQRLNHDKYKILMDKVIILGGSADKDKARFVKKWFPLYGRKMNYNGSNTYPTTRNMALIAINAETDNDSADAAVEWGGNIDFYFKDI